MRRALAAELRPATRKMTTARQLRRHEGLEGSSEDAQGSCEVGVGTNLARDGRTTTAELVGDEEVTAVAEKRKRRRRCWLYRGRETARD